MTIGDLVSSGALWVAVPIAVLAGLLSFLSPCVLPLVPGYLGFIAGAVQPRPALVPEPATGEGTRSLSEERSDETRRAEPTQDPAPGRARLLLGVVLFIAGFTVVFMAMNILGGVVGRFFIEYSDVIVRIMGVVIILMGLVFIGVFGFAQRTIKPQVRGNLGLIGAPLLGLALGLGWAPCIGPTLAVILGMSLDSASAGRGAILGLAYSLGLGIPFVLLTLGFGWATRSVAFLRRHIRAVNLLGGAVLIALGVLMVTGVWTTLMNEFQGVLLNVPLPL